MKLIVLHPFPADVDRFNQDYENHVKLLQRKMQIPDAVPLDKSTRAWYTIDT